MHLLIKRAFATACISGLLASQSYAQSANFLGNVNFDKMSGSEYISGNTPGTVLMKVNLWGGVNRPGIHHVPVKTDLMSLMSYAGGPTSNADLDDVTIKRDVGDKQQTIEVDVDDLISGASHHNLVLAPNDIVVVPQSKPLVSPDTMAVLGIISIVISAAVAISIVDRNQALKN